MPKIFWSFLLLKAVEKQQLSGAQAAENAFQQEGAAASVALGPKLTHRASTDGDARSPAGDPSFRG